VYDKKIIASIIVPAVLCGATGFWAGYATRTRLAGRERDSNARAIILHQQQFDGARKKLRDAEGSLSLELEAASASLETLKNLSIEQSGLINNVKLQWTLVSERPLESDQSWAWMTEDLITMEMELAGERANSARLERGVSFWRTAAVGGGVHL
jgi:hypothetical protein